MHPWAHAVYRTLAVMIGPLILAGILVALVWLGKRRRRGQRQITRERDRTHEAYLEFIHCWLLDQKIVDAAMETRVMTSEGFDMTLHALAEASYPEVRAIAARLLDNRVVRREIAKYMHREHGLDRQRFAMMAADMVERVRG
jgi:hypothetical protein